MSEADSIDERVTRLENQMADVHYLASRADREVSIVNVQNLAHTRTLNALRETQLEHGQKLNEHSRRLDRIERQANDNFQKVENAFGVVNAGMAHITTLLTDKIDGSGEEN